MKPPLFAKIRRKDGERELVPFVAHVLHVDSVVQALFLRRSPFVRRWLTFFCSSQKQEEQFLLHLRAACYVHACGKATDLYQVALRTPTGCPQKLRAEQIAALFLMLPMVREWFEPIFQVDLLLGTLLPPSGGLQWLLPEENADRRSTRISLYWDHPAVLEVLREVETWGHLAELPQPLPPSWEDTDAFWHTVQAEGYARIQEWDATYRGDRLGGRACMLRALRAAFTVVQAYAALFATTPFFHEVWLHRTLHSPCTPLPVNVSPYGEPFPMVTLGREWETWEEEPAQGEPPTDRIHAIRAAIWEWGNPARERQLAPFSDLTAFLGGNEVDVCRLPLFVKAPFRLEEWSKCTARQARELHVLQTFFAPEWVYKPEEPVRALTGALPPFVRDGFFVQEEEDST